TRALGPLPLIAEDLGFITPEVDVLKNWFGLPGMKVLPFTYPDLTADANTVFYTGTHDNDTLLGWIEEECIVEDEDETEEPSPCLISLDSQELARALSEEVFATEAGLVVLPVQDILGLDSTTRMNTPGSIEGNWRWQMSEPCAEAQKHWEWLQKITLASGRFH
ncbi:MAG: 4-alpha-glucanotransferase, partial [Coriobacteriia bacterium]|nr:4-alpha-glucanotransferase [Coriobacteriia bacterium]